MIALSRGPNGGLICEQDPGEIGYPGFPKRGSISDRECVILSGLCRGKMVLEIGTGLGVSTKALAGTAYLVDTLDVDPWVIENVHPHVAPARPFRLREDLNAKYGFAFIDGNHMPESVAEDIRFVREKMTDGGLVVLHDMRLETVQAGCDLAGVEVFRVETEFGLGLVVL